MSLNVETVDPGVEGVRRGVEAYCSRYPDFEEAIRVYGAVMEVQQQALAELSCPVTIDDEEIERKVASGVPLIKPQELELEPAHFRDVVAGICEAVEATMLRGGHGCAGLAEWEGLADGNLTGTIEAVLAGEPVGFGGFWDGAHSGGSASNLLWEALAPFVRVCGRILANKIEPASWLRGYCPICGAAPLFGKFREDDGLWLLECSLCHTMWNVHRADCPFCTESLGLLEFLFIEGDSSHRVQYCGKCRKYIKTVDLRSGEQDALLPLEDIVTMSLDMAAEEEGLARSNAYYPAAAG